MFDDFAEGSGLGACQTQGHVEPGGEIDGAVDMELDVEPACAHDGAAMGGEVDDVEGRIGGSEECFAGCDGAGLAVERDFVAAFKSLRNDGTGGDFVVDAAIGCGDGADGEVGEVYFLVGIELVHGEAGSRGGGGNSSRRTGDCSLRHVREVAGS